MRILVLQYHLRTERLKVIMTTIQSKERTKYHEAMEDFVLRIPKASIVYDIGKSNTHDYFDVFKDMDFKTIDRDKNKVPDIVLDIEKLNEFNADDYLELADAILCNGVVEQCDNPFKMIEACYSILKSNGIILFGMVLTGFPLYDNDRFRFTAQGAELAIKHTGFTILTKEIVQRDGVDTYVYVVAQKAKRD